MPTPLSYQHFANVIPLRGPRPQVVQPRVPAFLTSTPAGHLAVDTYDSCLHDCDFSLDGRVASGVDTDSRQTDVAAALAALFETTIGKPVEPSPWRALLARRVPIQIGWHSDAFPWHERHRGVTLALLRTLNHYRYPYVIATRSDLIAEDDYLREIDADLAEVRVAITGVNDRLTRLIEPGAPSLLRRFRAMAALAAKGVRTTAWLHPLLPTYPDGHYTNPSYAPHEPEPRLEVFDLAQLPELMDKLSHCQVPSLSATFAPPSQAAAQRIAAICGVDLSAFYPQSPHGTLEPYSTAEANHYLTAIASACKGAAVAFEVFNTTGK